MVTRRYRIYGKVQGVGFRHFACQLAHELKLRGWVRNLADGSVEALAIGSPQRLETFEKGLAKGPPNAEVNKVEQRDEFGGSEFNSFTIASDGVDHGPF